MSLRWSGIEARTRGLIHGPATLASVLPAAARLWAPRRELQRPIARREFIVDGLVPVAATHWSKLVVSAREGGQILWQRPFADRDEALLCYLRARGFDFERFPDGFWLPNIHIDGDLHIQLFDVANYTSTNSTNADWPTGNKCPSGVTATDALVIGGGGGGGGILGGGGGAGGFTLDSGHAVTAGTQYTITVPTAAAGGGAGGANGTDGGDGVFDTTTSGGGGGGGHYDGVAGSNGRASNGSSGGGGSGATGAAGGTANGGGGTGGTGQSGGNFTAGGGGGDTANGAAGSSNGNGGAGTASSISGSSVTYCGGGGGGSNANGNGTGGAGGGGNGGSSVGPTSPTAGTANLGGGGGGGNNSSAGASGSSGRVILSFSPAGQPIVKRRGGVPFTSPNARVW